MCFVKKLESSANVLQRIRSHPDDAPTDGPPIAHGDAAAVSTRPESTGMRFHPSDDSLWCKHIPRPAKDRGSQ